MNEAYAGFGIAIGLFIDGNLEVRTVKIYQRRYCNATRARIPPNLTALRLPTFILHRHPPSPPSITHHHPPSPPITPPSKLVPQKGMVRQYTEGDRVVVATREFKK